MNSVNSFANHAPKAGWVKDYLAKGGAFWTDNSLGPNQVGMFKRFLRDSGLMEDNAVTALFGLMNRLGGEHPAGWGLLLANLAYNPQCMWYINHMEIGRTYTREQIAEMLMEEGVSKNDATSIINAFKRFCDLPLGTALQFGSTAMTGRQISTLTRTKALVEDGRVVLYALFKFAEAWGLLPVHPGAAAEPQSGVRRRQPHQDLRAEPGGDGAVPERTDSPVLRVYQRHLYPRSGQDLPRGGQDSGGCAEIV